MPKVTCIGNIVADVVGRPIDALPERGKLTLVERISLLPGGCGANTALGLAKLGLETALVGKIGNDGFGDFMAGHFAKAGLDTSGLKRDSAAATSATIVIGHADGERSFLHDPGANAMLTRGDIDFGAIRVGKILVIAGVFLLPAFDGEPMAALLREARQAGIVTVLDTAWDATGRWMNLLAPCLPHLDYFLPSRDEAKMLASGRDDPDEIAGFFLNYGVGTVGIKLGSQGCLLRGGGSESLRIPALPTEVCDTLGAGNAFVAGFTAGLAKGWNLEKCGQFACAVAACVVESAGATTGLRDFAATQARMEQHYG